MSRTNSLRKSKALIERRCYNCRYSESIPVGYLTEEDLLMKCPQCGNEIKIELNAHDATPTIEVKPPKEKEGEGDEDSSPPSELSLTPPSPEETTAPNPPAGGEKKESFNRRSRINILETSSQYSTEELNKCITTLSKYLNTLPKFSLRNQAIEDLKSLVAKMKQFPKNTQNENIFHRVGSRKLSPKKAVNSILESINTKKSRLVEGFDPASPEGIGALQYVKNYRSKDVPRNILKRLEMGGYLSWTSQSGFTLTPKGEHFLAIANSKLNLGKSSDERSLGAQLSANDRRFRNSSGEDPSKKSDTWTTNEARDFMGSSSDECCYRCNKNLTNNELMKYGNKCARCYNKSNR